MWLTRYKDEISKRPVPSKYFCVISGGVWVIWNFDFQSEHVPQLSATQEVRATGVAEDITLILSIQKLHVRH